MGKKPASNLQNRGRFLQAIKSHFYNLLRQDLHVIWSEDLFSRQSSSEKTSTDYRKSVAAAAIFLAAKAEDEPRKIEHVVKVSHLCIHKDAPQLDVTTKAYMDKREKVLNMEMALLQTLGFNLEVKSHEFGQRKDVKSRNNAAVPLRDCSNSKTVTQLSPAPSNVSVKRKISIAEYRSRKK